MIKGLTNGDYAENKSIKSKFQHRQKYLVYSNKNAPWVEILENHIENFKTKAPIIFKSFYAYSVFLSLTTRCNVSIEFNLKK